MEIKSCLHKYAKDLKILNREIEVVGFSGVDHKLEFYPIEFSDGSNLEKDILMLKLKCMDTGISKGILVITNEVEISDKIWMMAKESNITLSRSVKRLKE